MKLDRNINDNGRGKYAVLKLRKLEEFTGQGTFGGVHPSIAAAISLLETNGILDWGNTPETEFFLIRLKDKYAAKGLAAYAGAAMDDGQREYGSEVLDLALRAGTNHPLCKMPD